jgi:MIP family channel proteins
MYTFTWNKYIAELIGTFALVLFGSMSVTLYARAGANLGFLSIAFAHGLTLLILVYSIGPISGCHINPAVTIGVWIAKKISSFEGVMYIIFQLLGAALAGVVHAAILPATTANFGIPTVAAGNEATGLVIEAILTFFLVFTVFGTAINPKAPPGVAGVAIGMALTVGLIMGGPITGGALNPARWFGPAIAANSLNQWWVYIFGPIIGGGLAAYLYSTLFMKTEKD